MKRLLAGLLLLAWPATAAASQLEPSCNSPSPVSTMVRNGEASICPAMAIRKSGNTAWTIEKSGTYAKAG